MAGRGTDIKLGGPRAREEHDRVAALGGLYVIGTNRHESLRIDSQLRGRAGRQGDPGSSRFFISLEDDIFERYGLTRRLFSRYRLERRRRSRRQRAPAQGDRPRPARHRGPQPGHPPGALGLLRRSSRRRGGSSPAGATRSSLPTGERPVRRSRPRRSSCEAGTAKLGRDPFERLARRAALFHIDDAWADHLAWLADLREGIHLVSIGRKEPLQEFQKAATGAFLELEDRIGAAIDSTLRSLIAREGPVDLEAAGLKGPSSTWTYLVNEDQFGWGVELLKGTNIGVAAGAAAFYGPLFLLALIVNRFKRKEEEGVKP